MKDGGGDRGWPAFGPRAGQKVLTVQGAMPRDTDFKQSLCADDRPALKPLCLYITGPAPANERVQTNGAGPVVLKLMTRTVQALAGADIA